MELFGCGRGGGTRGTAGSVGQGSLPLTLGQLGIGWRRLAPQLTPNHHQLTLDRPLF